MAANHSVDYKTLYSPEESLSHIREISQNEEDRNYFYVAGCTDLGAFLTPASIKAIQQNIRRFRTNVGDRVFGECEIQNGLTNDSYTHINIDLKTYVDFGEDNSYEVVVM